MHAHADQLRLLPEADPDFAKLYGLRNDAESNNNSYKRTLPGRRAAALGWRRQLLDLAGWAILVNSRAHARHHPAPTPVNTVADAADPLDRLLGPTPPPPNRTPPRSLPAPRHRPPHALLRRILVTLLPDRSR